MPHDLSVARFVCSARARRTVSPAAPALPRRPRAPPTLGAPRRRLDAPVPSPAPWPPLPVCAQSRPRDDPG
eukprot:4023161-Prymnesium_polylepis.1